MIQNHKSPHISPPKFFHFNRCRNCSLEMMSDLPKGTELMSPGPGFGPSSVVPGRWDPAHYCVWPAGQENRF